MMTTTTSSSIRVKPFALFPSLRSSIAGIIFIITLFPLFPVNPYTPCVRKFLSPVQYQNQTLPDIERIRHIYIKKTYLSAPDDSDAAASVVAATLGVVSDVVLLLNKGMSSSSTGRSERTPKRSAIMNAITATISDYLVPAQNLYRLNVPYSWAVRYSVLDSRMLPVSRISSRYGSYRMKMGLPSLSMGNPPRKCSIF